MLSGNMFGTSLGLEFKEGSVILTCLKNNLSGVSLISYAEFALKDNDESVIDINAHIHKYCDRIDKVFVSVPDKWAITKFIEMPPVRGKSKSSLEGLMKFEIERHIPFPIEDVAYDFLVLDESKAADSVVFTAVKKEKINYVKELLDKLSLKPESITISSFAVLNTIERNGITAGGWQEIIGIVRRSEIIGNHGEAVISLFFSKVGVTVATIRDGICTQLRAFSADAGQSLDEYLDGIVKYFHEIQSRYSISRFRRIIISGDTSASGIPREDLEQKLREKLDAEEQVMSFSGKLGGTEINGLESAIGAAFAGMGIGSYRINMLPHKMGYAVRTIAPLTTKVLLVLAIILAVGIFATDIIKQKRLLEGVEQAISENEPAMKEIEALTAETAALSEQGELLNNIEDGEIALELLAELANILPASSWVTSLTYKPESFKNLKGRGGELVISGYAASSSSLLPLLEDSPFFRNVEFVGPIKKTRDNEQFKLGARVVALDEDDAAE